MVIVSVANYFKQVMYKHVIWFKKYTYFKYGLILVNFAMGCLELLSPIIIISVWNIFILFINRN